jgi:hypothetical protein
MTINPHQPPVDEPDPTPHVRSWSVPLFGDPNHALYGSDPAAPESAPPSSDTPPPPYKGRHRATDR